MHDENLFRSAGITPVLPLVTPLTLGLIKVYRLRMERDNIYSVDVGFNDVFVYDVTDAGHREKYFWKLNIEGNPIPEVEWIQKNFNVLLEVPNIPSFDPQFGPGGGWVTMNYNVRVTVRVSRERVAQVRQAVNPKATVCNVVKDAVRNILPYTPFQEALIAKAREEIQAYVMEAPVVQVTGLQVEYLAVEAIEGSKELAKKQAERFDRLAKAEDDREIALQFASLDEDVYRRILERAAPDKALEMGARFRSQMLESMLLSQGNDLKKVASITSRAAHEINKPVGLAGELATEALKRIEVWESPSIPQDVTHKERLRWEQQVVEERVPHQLQSLSDSDDTFTFVLETGDELKIIWWSPDSPPEMLINGLDKRSDYVCLSPGIYDYNKTTVWDLYWETRRLLGLLQEEEEKVV